MDKPSERKRDYKKSGDTDIGYHEYGPGNCREQLDGLWSIPSKKMVGLGPERILTNNYCKTAEKGEGSAKEEKVDLMEEILNNGPPLLNVSAPNRVL